MTNDTGLPTVYDRNEGINVHQFRINMTDNKPVLCRDGFKDTTFAAKAKARQVRGQGQGRSQIGSRPGRGQN
jgi:hypothetical protein